MRPKCSLMNLLLLTTICALGAQVYRQQRQLRSSRELIGRYETFRAQVDEVAHYERELESAIDQLQPKVDNNFLYRAALFGGPKVSELSSKMRLEISPPPVGMRRELSHIRNYELKLLQEKSVLDEIGSEIAATRIP